MKSLALFLLCSTAMAKDFSWTDKYESPEGEFVTYFEPKFEKRPIYSHSDLDAVCNAATKGKMDRYSVTSRQFPEKTRYFLKDLIFSYTSTEQIEVLVCTKEESLPHSKPTDEDAGMKISWESKSGEGWYIRPVIKVDGTWRNIDSFYSDPNGICKRLGHDSGEILDTEAAGLFSRRQVAIGTFGQVTAILRKSWAGAYGEQVKFLRCVNESSDNETQPTKTQNDK